MSLAALKKQLKEGQFLRCYLLWGEETFLTDFYTKSLCDKAAPQMPDFNLHLLDGKDCTLAALSDAVDAVPVFAERQCVCVRDLDVDALAKDDQRQLAEIVEGVPEQTVLVFSLLHVQPEAKKKAKWRDFFALVQKNGLVVECARPSETELAKWAVKAAARYRAVLSLENAGYLISLVGREMQQLKGEIEKLAQYADGEITREHIDRLAIRTTETTVYAMVGALGRRDFTSAATSLGELFDARERPEMILGAVAKFFADICRARAGADCGKSTKEIAADFGYRGREFIITNALRDARNFTDEYLRACIACTMQADARLKGSRTDNRVVLEELLAQIAAVGMK